MEYILLDPDLNVNRAADEFHVTPTCAARVFRQEFQCRILNYIRQIRVDEAKRRPGHTAAVKEISGQVGFSALQRSCAASKSWRARACTVQRDSCVI